MHRPTSGRPAISSSRYPSLRGRPGRCGRGGALAVVGSPGRDVAQPRSLVSRGSVTTASLRVSRIDADGHEPVVYCVDLVGHLEWAEVSRCDRRPDHQPGVQLGGASQIGVGRACVQVQQRTRAWASASASSQLSSDSSHTELVRAPVSARPRRESKSSWRRCRGTEEGREVLARRARPTTTGRATASSAHRRSASSSRSSCATVLSRRAGDDHSVAGHARGQPREVTSVLNHPVTRQGRVETPCRGDDDSTRSAHDGQCIPSD